MESEYEFGYCRTCNQWAALKDGICAQCEDKKIPDFLKELFKKNEETK